MMWSVLRGASLLHPQRLQVYLRQVPQEFFRPGGNHIREHQDKPRQMVYGNVSYQQQQERRIVTPIVPRLEHHAKNRMVHSP